MAVIGRAEGGGRDFVAYTPVVCVTGYSYIVVCALAEASSSKHYGTSDSGAGNGQEDESSAGQSDAKDDETSRVGAARAAAFILISCRPSTSDSPSASPGRAKRAKKLGTFKRHACKTRSYE